MSLVSVHRWNRITKRAANVMLTSQFWDSAFYKTIADGANLYEVASMQIYFGFDWSYEALLFSSDPCAWLYIKVHGLGDSQVDSWHANKDFLMSWEGPQSSKMTRHVRPTGTPSLWHRTSNSCIWCFLSFAPFLSVTFRRGTKVRLQWS